MTGPKKRGDAKHQARGDRTAVERVSDPYRTRRKWPEPTACPECGAIYHHGHWQWGEAAAAAARHLCPACERVRDRLPAGLLTLSGEFYETHRDEILHLVRNTESKARAEHPLERIMDLKDEGKTTVVTLTDSHLVHGIGNALRHAYHGTFDCNWTEESDLLRGAWRR